MESVKTKTQIYLLIFSLVASIVGIAIIKLDQSKPANPGKQISTSQKLDALEKGVPQSSGMAKFLRNEKDAQDAEDEAARDMPK